MPADTVPFRILRNGEFHGDRPAYFEKAGGSWQQTTWRGYADQVAAAAKSLIALGVVPGNAVTILGFNRPEWVIMDVAAMAVGGVPAGIYATNSPRECRYIIEHSRSRVVLLEDEGQWAKVAAVKGNLPDLHHVVMMRGAPDIDDPMVLSWDEFMAKGVDVDTAALEARLAGLKPEDLATLIYTSGTTGPPKAVMLSHDNLLWTASQAAHTFAIDSDDSNLSYLPLSHIAEQVFTVHVPAISAGAVYYAESIDVLVENLREVRPSIFFAVPRVWERFHAGVIQKLGETTGVKAKLASWAMAVAGKVNGFANEGKEPPAALRVQYKIADKLVLSKVKAALGLDRARLAVSGAAPVSKEILEFFSRLDLAIREVYGQSEDTGPSSINQEGMTKYGSGGPVFPGVELRIADDGEILVRGRNVFLGYYRDPETTAATLVDGWLHSGDLGEIDDDGFLWITGRKKDIIITAGGKNIAPKPLEEGLKNHPLVSEVVVIGDRRRFLSALVTVDEEAAARFMAERGVSGPAHEADLIHQEVQVAVNELNKDFARVEQIKKFAILPRQLSIEGGELTPTLKVKRAKVSEHFADVIDRMYQE